MKICPSSGLKKPAARFNNVVFPHPEGPRRVINSPRRTASETSHNALTALNRLDTRSKRTAMSSQRSAIDLLDCCPVLVVAFDIEHSAKAKKRISNDQQYSDADNIHDRQCGHGRISVFSYIIIHCDGQRLCPLTCN